MADAEWMYGDVATGALGFAELARFSPFRWSGVKSIGATIVELETYMDHPKTGAETRKRPVVLKCPGGITGREQRFESMEEAHAYLKTRAGFMAEWMWGDAGTGLIGIEHFARLAPYRWSVTRTIDETVEDLEKHVKENPADASRPVVFKIPAGVLSPEQRGENVADAIQKIKRFRNLIGFRWAPEQSEQIGSEEAKFKDKVPLLEGKTSVMEAVDALNSGTITCEKGVGVVYSEALESYVLLWRGDMRDQALAIMKLKLEVKIDWRHIARAGDGPKEHKSGDMIKALMNQIPGFGHCTQAVAEGFDCKRFVMKQSGNILVRYNKKDPLGQGVGGTVTLIDRKHTGQQYVFKEAFGDADGEEVKREYEAMNALRHPNVVKLVELLFEQNDDGDKVYTISEFAHGGDLKKYMESVAQANQQLSEASIGHIFRQCVLGTAYMHDQQYVHNDLKPDNVLVMEKYHGDVNAMPRVVITDFGCSAKQGEAGSLGDPRYAGPDMMEAYKRHFDEKMDPLLLWRFPEVDTWSLGVTLFELLSSKPGEAGVIPFIYKSASEFPAAEIATAERLKCFQNVILGVASSEKLADDADTVLYGYPVKVEEHLKGVSKPAMMIVSNLLAKPNESPYRKDIKELLGVVDSMWMKQARGAAEEAVQVTFTTQADEVCQIMMNAVMWRLEFDDGLRNVKKAFERFNECRSGKVSRTEFIARFADKTQAEKVFDLADIDGDGFLEFNEFAAISYDWSSILEEKLKLLLQELLLDITGTKAGIKEFLGKASDESVNHFFTRMGIGEQEELTADIFFTFIVEGRSKQLKISES